MMKKYTRPLGIFCLMLMIVFSAITTSATTVDILKPATGHYVDQADVLSDDIKKEIESQNTNLGKTAEIYVVTVANTGVDTISQYATNIYQTWEIGGTAKNGILFLVSVGDNGSGANYYSIVGEGISSGFEGTGLSQILADDVEPFFALADYDSAVQNFLSKSVLTIQNSTAVTPTPSPDENEKTEDKSFFGSVWAVIKVILIIILVILILAIALLVFLNIRANNIKKQRRMAKRAKSIAKPLQEVKTPQVPTEDVYSNEVIDSDIPDEFQFEDIFSDDK